MKQPAILPKHLPYTEKPLVKASRKSLPGSVKLILGLASVGLFFTSQWWIGVGIVIFMIVHGQSSKDGRLGFCPNCFTKLVLAGAANNGTTKCSHCRHKLGIYGDYIVDFDGMPRHGEDNKVNLPAGLVPEYDAQATNNAETISAERTASASKQIEKIARYGLYGLIAILLTCTVIVAMSPKAINPPAKVKEHVSSADVPIVEPSRPEHPPENQYIDTVKAFENFLTQAEADFKSTPAAQSDLERVRKTAVMFGILADHLNNARLNKATLSAGDIKYLKSVESRLSKFQTKTLPGLRQAYAKETGKLMWEHDVEVWTSGKGNHNLEFSGGMFATNTNIKQSFETISDLAQQLRYKQVRFRWYRQASEYTHYKLDPLPDAQLAMFKFGKMEKLATPY